MMKIDIEEFSVHEKETQKWIIVDEVVDLLTENVGDDKAIETVVGIDRKNLSNWKAHKVGISDRSFELVEEYCRTHCIDIARLSEFYAVYKGWSTRHQSSIDKYRQAFIPEGNCKIWPDGEIPWNRVYDINSTVYDIRDRIPLNLLTRLLGHKMDYIIPKPEFLDLMQMEYAYPDKNLAEVYANEAKIPFSSAMQVLMAYRDFCNESRKLGFGKEYWTDLLQKWNADVVVEPSWESCTENI